MSEKRELQFIPDPEERKAPEQSKTDLGLTPEIKEMIMDKVGSVNETGNAITAIRGLRIDSKKDMEELHDILEMGLLGTQGGMSSDKGERKSSWRKAAKKGESKIWVNIVGPGGDIPAIDSSLYMEIDDTEIALLLDLQKFTHKLPEGLSQKGSSKSFRASAGGSYIGHIVSKAVESGFNPAGTMEELKSFILKNKEKLKLTSEDKKFFGRYYITDPETGFVVSHRIAPRYFRGLIFRPKKKNWGSSPFSDSSSKVIQETDPAIIDKKLKEITEEIMLTYSKKPELMMPIYDIHGNLLWPEKMSHSELRKLVAQRDNDGNKEGIESK